MNPKGEQMKTTLIRGLAIVGFIAILFVGLWGSVQVVKRIPGAISNLAAVTSFRSVFVPNEELTITIPNLLIPSNEVFELSWEHKGKSEDGTYAFRYACKEGLSFSVSTTKGAQEEITCDTPFVFSNDVNSLSLTPFSEVNRFVDVPFSITSIHTNGEPITLDDSFFTIVNESISGSSLSSRDTGSDAGSDTGTPLTPGEKTSQVFPISDSRSVSNPNGQVDLSVRIIDTGIIDTKDLFIPSKEIGATQNGAIKFSVTNIGSKTSDNWTFNVVLPTYPMHIFHSTGQKALQPGDRIDFTLGFDQLNARLSEGVITVNVDPAGSIRNEFNRDNNIAQITFKITP